MEPNPNYVVMFGEFDAPKTNIEPYLKLMTKTSKAFAAWKKKGIVKDFHSWTDNTGHFIVFILFESMDKFAELWNEQDYHNIISESSMFLENMQLRLMRPAFAPE